MNHEIKQHRLTKEPPTVKKWILYILLLWLLVILQASFLSHLTIFGAVIEIAFAMILFFGWKQSPLVGGIYGIVGGFLLDALTYSDHSLIPLLFFAGGVYASFAAKRLHDHPLTYLIMTVPAHVVLAAWRGVCEKSVGHALAVILAGLIGSMIVYIPAAVRFFKRKS